jgi:zeaxanthin glucosyltransferase
MIAIPIGCDQPGVAARIAHHGGGEFIELDELTTKRLSGLIEKVLQNPIDRARANYFRKVISKTCGLDVAAEIIEQTFQKYRAQAPRNSHSILRAKRKTPKDTHASMTGIVTASSDKLDSWDTR